MVGTKRALSQVDGNLAKSQPPSKRKSGDLAPGKENATVDYANMKKDELSTILRGRDLPHSGNKATLIRRLKEDDGKPSSAVVSEKTNESGNAVTTEAAEHEFDYWTLCRPPRDIQAEKRATDSEYDSYEEDEAEDEHEERAKDEHEKQDESESTGGSGQQKSSCGAKNCICKLPASQHPEQKWLLTKEGYLLTARLQREVAIRDQDMIGEHFYSDFNGYGFQEVMENQLLSFNREYTKKNAKPASLWSIIEGFAWILDEQDHWFNIDDPETVLATLRMIGGAMFTTLNTLEKHDLLGPDSPVKNIALVVGVLFDKTRDWPSGEDEPELAWRGAIIKEAQKHGIVFKEAPYGIEDLLRKEGLGESEQGKGSSKWKRFNWIKEASWQHLERDTIMLTCNKFTSFHRRHRKGSSIGGRQYALETEQERAEARIAFNFWPSDHSESDDELGPMIVYVGK